MMLGCFSPIRSWISRVDDLGMPMSVKSIYVHQHHMHSPTRFKATTSPVCLCTPLNTDPYVPFPMHFVME